MNTTLLPTPRRRALCTLSCLALLLGGCADFWKRPTVEDSPTLQALDPVDGALKQSSADLAQRLEQLEQALEKAAPPPPPEPPPEAFDSEALKKTISIDVRGASIGPLLALIASELGVSMSIDPYVLELPQRANLHLHKVSGKQALMHILHLFDVGATMDGDGVVVVSLTTQRLFETDIMQGRSQLQAGAGGDLMGGGAKEASSGLKDVATLSTEFGDKADGFEGLQQSLEALMGKAANPGDPGANHFSVDKANGLMLVTARPSVMALVEKLLRRSRSFRERSIQVDAQLLDVAVNDGKSLGLDWNLLHRNLLGRLGTDGASVSGLSGAGTLDSPPSLSSRQITLPAQAVGGVGSAGGLLLGNDSFSVAINALRSMGHVRVLSNPTLRLRNGVPAYLNVGTNIRYVRKITVQSNLTSAAGTSSTDVETDAIFSGISIGVSALAKENGHIELFVKPSQNRVNTQSLSLTDVGGGNKVSLPVVETKSVATTLNLRSGETVLIGGLIDQQLGFNDSGIPGLSDSPAIGALFGNYSKTHAAREMVIVLRARVLP